MNDRQLRTFITCAETGSFSKAAKISYISTPALIQQISALEAGLGFSLFERKRNGIILTPEGTIFLEASRQILDIYDNTCQTCRELQNEEKNLIKIACAANQIPNFILGAVSAFNKNYPEIKVSFIDLPYNEHITEIQNGNVDLSVMAEPTDQILGNLYFKTLAEDTYAFCMNADHPLAKLPLITGEDLKGYKILCGYYPFMKQSFDKQLQKTGADLTLIHTEYDSDVRTRSLLGDEIFAVHSLWSKNYQTFFSVVQSDISAGKIGAVYKDSKACRLLLPYLEWYQKHA